MNDPHGRPGADDRRSASATAAKAPGSFGAGTGLRRSAQRELVVASLLRCPSTPSERR